MSNAVTISGEKFPGCFMQLLVALLSRFSFITGKKYALGISDGLNCH